MLLKLFGHRYQDSNETEKDWEKQGHVDGVLLVFWKVQKCQQRVVEEHLL